MLKLLPEWLKIGGAAFLGGLVTFSVYATINALVLIPAAEQRGRDNEAAELTAATNIAIGELSNAADQARVRRRLCVERHGVYDFAKGECIEAKPDVND